jgi:2-hydroxychromene-2-carboxylate isomerase
MAKTIQFIFDFGSPNAYLALHALRKLVQGSDAEIELVPVLLGGIFKLTGNQAPMMAFASVKGKLDYDRLEMDRFIIRHQLSRFRFNPHFPVNTLLLMRGMVAAQHLGVEQAYVDAGLIAMWEDGRKMDDPDVFVETLNAAGLDGAKLLDAAAARGVFGIPTFFVGDDMYFGKERLGQIQDQIARA